MRSGRRAATTDCVRATAVGRPRRRLARTVRDRRPGIRPHREEKEKQQEKRRRLRPFVGRVGSVPAVYRRRLDRSVFRVVTDYPGLHDVVQKM